MGARNKGDYFITLCIPQIANYVKSEVEYKNNLVKAKKAIRDMARELKIKKLELAINTRDNFKATELYLTATGSSIESGDEGLVGRGNRVNKIISPTKPMSIEGACGKNPVYHIGKLYYLASHHLAQKIYHIFGIRNEVYMISQSGRRLIDPWICFVNVPKGFRDKQTLSNMIKREMKKIPSLTDDLLAGKYTLS